MMAMPEHLTRAKELRAEIDKLRKPSEAERSVDDWRGEVVALLRTLCPERVQQFQHIVLTKITFGETDAEKTKRLMRGLRSAENLLTEIINNKQAESDATTPGIPKRTGRLLLAGWTALAA